MSVYTRDGAATGLTRYLAAVSKAQISVSIHHVRRDAKGSPWVLRELGVLWSRRWEVLSAPSF